jgi:UDP-glucose 4-epimerase
MRVVVVGATGNVGTALLQTLGRDQDYYEVVGVARRLPRPDAPGSAPHVEWHAADVGRDDLVPIFLGADAFVHLAWEIQPSRDLARLRHTNVIGSERVFRAVVEAGVPSLVYASSVAAYARGPKNRRVDESWPADGIPSSFYSRHKAEVEHLLDRLERERTVVRVVRLRPALVFARRAASEIRRLFVGPLFPSGLAQPQRVPFVPDIPGLVLQAVHADDAAEAYRLALDSDVRGPFNIAAEPPLDAHRVATLLGARRLPVPRRVARAAVSLAWRLRLQPTPAGWLDLGLQVPLLDTTRAHSELGWTPRLSAEEALLELLAGIHEHAGAATPPLDPGSGGPARACELAADIGGSSR